MGRDYGKGMANGGKVAKYADGGMIDEAALKAEGLRSSAGEKVGLLERIRMGNIDQPGSEAYNRFGAGRAKADAQNAASDRQLIAKAAPKPMDDVPTIESERAGSTMKSGEVAAAPASAPATRKLPAVVGSGFGADVASGIKTVADARAARGTNRAPGANTLPDAPKPAAPAPAASPAPAPARAPLIANPKTSGQRMLNSAAGAVGSAIENSGPVRGLRAVGRAIADTFSGGAPKALPKSPGVLRQQEEDEARRAARRNPEGMANGGMVGRKSYGKKC